MIDTPTMSLRVPQNSDMRRALREAARALRQGQVSATALLHWLAEQQMADDSLTRRVDALEDRLSALEAVVRQEFPART